MSRSAAALARVEQMRPAGPDPLDQWTPEVYHQLRKLARSQRTKRPCQDTLNTTGLVHEAFLKMADRSDGAWRDQGHFFAVSATAMRQILIDAARSRLSQKRGAGQGNASLDDVVSRSGDVSLAEAHAADVLAVNDALEELRTIDPRLCQLVECRFFAGLTHEETALAMNSSVRTVYRDWLRAKAWLRRSLGGSVDLE